MTRKTEQCKKLEELTILQTEVKNLDAKFDEVHVALFGNGRPGIKDKVGEIVGGIKMMKYLGSIGGLSLLVATIIAIVK